MIACRIQGEADPGDCDATLTGMIFCFAMMGSSFAAVACRLCIYHTLGRKGSAYHSWYVTNTVYGCVLVSSQAFRGLLYVYFWTKCIHNKCL